MSLEVWKAVLVADIQDPTKKLVLMAMANHAHPDGTDCYPSIPRVAIYTGLKERSVTRTIAALVEDGLVRRVGGGYRGSSAGYEINMYALSALHHPRIDRVTGKLLREKPDSLSVISPAVGDARGPDGTDGGKPDGGTVFRDGKPPTARRKADSDAIQPDPGGGKTDSDSILADSDSRKTDGESAYPSLSESNREEKTVEPARPSSLAPGASHDQTIYVQALAVLQRRLPKSEFATWVQPTSVVEQSIKDGILTVVLGPANSYAARALRQHLPAIEAALAEVSHCPVSVSLHEAA
jgi:hypothetical protein